MNIEKFLKNQKGAKMEKKNRENESTRDIWFTFVISIALLVLGGAHIVYCVFRAKWALLLGPLFYTGLSVRNIIQSAKLWENYGCLKALEDMIAKKNSQNRRIQLMVWTKLTPSTMPAKNKRVILTTRNKDGSKTTDVAKWCGEKLGWMILLPGFHPSTLETESVQFEITHWMPYPEAEED